MLYTIHSWNAELLHFLESNKIPPPHFKNEVKIQENEKYIMTKEKVEENDSIDNNYLKCFCESIKFHHKEFSEYWNYLGITFWVL